MDKKNIIIVAIAGLVVIVGVAVFAFQKGESQSSEQNNGTGAASTGASQSGYSATHTPAPANIVVPNEGSATTSAGVAVPSTQAAAAPGSSASYRNFSITIAKNNYNLNTVIVNQGDTVNLEITALDADYGFTQPDYGFNASIGKGKTQTIQFQATSAGKFTFYCGSCGGPSKGPVGYLIVSPH